MKKYLSFQRVFVMLAIVSGFQYEAKGQQLESVEGIWSGTVTMHERYDGFTGWSEQHISISFTDNKGYGTVKSESELIVGGIKMGKGDCNGNGVAKLLYLKFNFYKKTYRINVTGPVCSNGSDPNSNSHNDILIDDKPLGGNPNLLSGTETTINQIPNDMGKVTTTITWNLFKAIDAELIVTPEKYDTWLPEPGKDEVTVGTVMNISLKLQGKNGKPLSSKAKAFELRLSNTSKEPGITLNAPLNPTIDLPDLRFMPQPNGKILEDFQFITISCPGCITANVKVGSYDGGGWTTLIATAILEDNTRVRGNLLVSGGETEVRIPKRIQGSKIATAWLTANGNPGEMDDIEKSKDNNNNGDGLTAYEEYRGVISQGKFRRLDPNKKEVGILATQTDFTVFSDGISWFKNASDLEIIRFDFDKNEIAGDGRLNVNKKSAHDYDQYALYLINGGLGGSTLGIVYSKTRTPDIPAQIISVVADWDKIKAAYQRRVNGTRPETLKFTLREYLAQTVAHELGHAINIWHHGNANPYDDFIVNENSDRYRIFDRNGNLKTDRPYPLDNIGFNTGTVESGDMSCMLNYYPYYSWGYTVGIDGAHIFNQEPLLPLGKIFCKSKNGTGINATRLYFGDADNNKGNCLHQIQLRN